MANENAWRFLKSYNNIESNLKQLYHAKPTQNFTDLIKRCSDLNLTVRRYESELIDYGKLRNAIVHRQAGVGDVVIANPCDDVVKQIEYIDMMICKPPKILEVIKVKKIVSVFADSPLLNALDAFAECWQKTLIVYDHGTMLGFINCYALYATIAEKVKNGEDVTAYLSDTKCGDALFDHELDRYMLLSISATVVDVFAAFEQNKNLIAVIITESGQMGEKALTMVTPADFPRINKYLETYGKLSEYKESIIQ